MGSCSECKQKCSITWADGTANGDCAGAATWKTVCENGVWGTSEAEGNCHRQANCDYGGMEKILSNLRVIYLIY